MPIRQVSPVEIDITVCISNFDITHAAAEEYTIENLTIVPKEGNTEKVAVNLIENYDPLDQMDLVKCFSPAPKQTSRFQRVKKTLMRGATGIMKHTMKKLSIELVYFQFSPALHLFGL